MTDLSRSSARNIQTKRTRKLRSGSPSPLVAALASAVFFCSSSSSRRLTSSSTPFAARKKTLNHNANSHAAAPEYSFVTSLEKFLASQCPPADGSSIAAADDGGTAAEALDDNIWEKEMESLYGDPVDPWSGLSVVRVYVSAKFTCDLLWLFRNAYSIICFFK